ncbi:MAG: hypothetical protein GXY23_17040 [Myxococcales bacterium]|jgi:hypothetical protein|nr:hypothetical protein [Myxococcales bacterium]
MRTLASTTLAAWVALASPSKAEAPIEQDAPSCVKVRGEPRYQGYGQTHVVVVKNGCDKTVRCEVFTDVDPTPRYTLLVAPGETEEVATRRGSPSSAFRPGYRCELR